MPAFRNICQASSTNSALSTKMREDMSVIYVMSGWFRYELGRVWSKLASALRVIDELLFHEFLKLNQHVSFLFALTGVILLRVE